MINLEELLKKRSNITFFRQDKVPSKEIIEDILEKTHNLMPHKNNLWETMQSKTWCRQQPHKTIVWVIGNHVKQEFGRREIRRTNIGPR